MFKNIEKIENAALKNYCTFRVGGPARYMLFPKSVDEVCECHQECLAAHLPFFVLGNGSNVLFSDDGFDGAIINLKNLAKVELSKTSVLCEAGVNLFYLNKLLAESELGGLEFSYGIPGSVGGAVKMNAGAYGGEICKALSSVTVLKEGKVLEKTDLDFSYRRGPVLDNEILILAKFSLNHGKKSEILQKHAEILQKRKATQPHNFSAGSVFKRQGEIVPAKLIDEWGLKGTRVGGAVISPVHAGFIVNDKNAKSSDILELIELVKFEASRHGLCFECEIKIIDQFALARLQK